ncbi:MAG TPA: AsmA family protein [Acidobacteriaceae bacterium]
MTIDSHDQDDEAGPPGRGRQRLAYFFIALLVVLLLAFIPPLLNVSRFQRRVDAEISAALGRPVHFDRLSLNLLPIPGFTLENFVIEEDPTFGYEPTLHADEVRINIRLNSLWRRRVEFSSISFTDPSVNLVHTADGRWNLQGLLLQASHIPAAPTAQAHSGPAARFPYIEATGARVNLKLDQEKTPIALTEADFALWQPAEHKWQLRIEARPLRSDIAPGASGTLRVEGTLGSGGDHATLADIPVDLRGSWQDAQLGGLTSLLLGRDAGLRGDLTSSLAMLGTIGSNTITATLRVENARRADFIPPHPLSLSVGCRATAENSFHSFTSIQCRLPPSASSAPAMLALVAKVPDVRRPELASLRLDVPSLPSQTLYDWLGVATPHPPTAFAGRGTLRGALQWGAPPEDMAAVDSGHPASTPGWTGELRLSGEWLKLPALGDKGVPLDDVVLSATTQLATDARTAHPAKPQSQPAQDSFDLAPVSLPLGGVHSATLTGHVDDGGYSLHLAGSVVLDELLALGDAIPQFGDGLKQLLAPEDSPASQSLKQPNDAPERASSATRGHSAPEVPPPAPPTPISVDLSAARAWGGPQIWTQAASAPATPEHRHHAKAVR